MSNIRKQSLNRIKSSKNPLKIPLHNQHSRVQVEKITKRTKRIRKSNNRSNRKTKKSE